ncbi:MAG TPA: GAF domain-containing protein [Leptolyngbyaceae cyanobacterium]
MVQVSSSNGLDTYIAERDLRDGVADFGLQPVEGDWLRLIQQQSQLAIALLSLRCDRTTGQLHHDLLFATDTFHCLFAVQPESNGDFFQHLSGEDQDLLRRRFNLHLLNAILHHHYGIANLVDERWLNEPVVVTLPTVGSKQKRRLELRLRYLAPQEPNTPLIQIRTLDTTLIETLATCWPAVPTRSQVMAQLLAEESPLKTLLAELNPTQYEASGYALLEGVDVSEREVAKVLVRLLVNRESVLEPAKFGKANELIKQLFRADGSLILSAENKTAKLFMGLEKPEWDIYTYPVTTLQQSSFFQAIGHGQVINIPDLSLIGTTDCEHQILEQGVRSLLIIPLAIKSTTLSATSRHLLGLVGVTSSQPYAFSEADCERAKQLVSPLTAALRHTVQDRFTNIHSSVRWRFEQEAERRSWGLPPEPIVFENVFPLYGISDVRGSSEERNRAIQTDLLTQFRLGLEVMEAVCEAGPNAFANQFRTDLIEHIQDLEQGITVDAEVTLLRYLQDTLETYFDYFAQCSPAAAQAVATYQSALCSEQGCVYAARAIYDRSINHINTLLRDTWTRWQKTMQSITRHYCDIEATDGIDHMIYAGHAIDPQFTPFHLSSLRYEQLRGMCDCARAALGLKEIHQTSLEVTHLVLVQASTVDITHDENTERLFDVRGTRDTRYEIVKKRIDKARDMETHARITQPGMLTIVYSTDEEWQEYRQYLRYLHREGWVEGSIVQGNVESLQGVNGLKFARVRVLPGEEESGGRREA